MRKANHMATPETQREQWPLLRPATTTGEAPDFHPAPGRARRFWEWLKDGGHDEMAAYSQKWTGAQVVSSLIQAAAFLAMLLIFAWGKNDDRAERLVRAETRVESMQKEMDRIGRRADAALALAVANMDPETAKKLTEQMKEQGNADTP